MTRVLITNDDGIDSAVLVPLARALGEFCDVSVVVPNKQQSGVGHAFTFYSSLSYNQILHDGFDDLDFYTIDGTPADCVKFAFCKLFKDQQFDLVISGINNQLNTGIAVYYSGTVAGAREAALMQVPGIAISAVDFSAENLGYGISWLTEFVKDQIFENIPAGKYWNINLPDLSQEGDTTKTSKGVKFCAMGQVMYEDNYFPEGLEVGASYTLKGMKPEGTMVPGTDDFEQNKGFVTITPLTLDQGDAQELNRLSKDLTDFTHKFASI